jgi:hypothetical protein
MHRARMCLAEKRNRKVSIHQHDLLHRVTCFLAAVMAFLVIWIFGALDASVGAIMAKRGGLN